MTEESVSNVVQEEVGSDSVDTSSEQVSYDSHKKAINQLKKSKQRSLELQTEREGLLEELSNYRDRDKEVEHKKLEEKGEYDKILVALRSENKSLQEQISEDKNQRLSRLKKEAFLKALPGPLHNDDYINLAKLDGIAVDPETGDIDVLTVKESVDGFVIAHPALMRLKKAEEVATKTVASPAARPVNLQHLDKSAKQLTALEQLRQLRLSEIKK